MMNYCKACSARGLCRLGITDVRIDSDGQGIYELSCPPENEAANGVAHGGWAASALNEVFGQLFVQAGSYSVVVSLTTNFKKPMPVGVPLAARAWVQERDRNRWHISGEITLKSSGIVLAGGHGTYLLRDLDAHYQKFGKWLQEQ